MSDLDGYDADPELGDENDPEYKEEMFRSFRHMGWKPEDIATDPVYAAEYAEWLKTAPPDDEEP
jgi:hypothetical protein